jgi:hypothetical protein
MSKLNDLSILEYLFLVAMNVWEIQTYITKKIIIIHNTTYKGNCVQIHSLTWCYKVMDESYKNMGLHASTIYVSW